MEASDARASGTSGAGVTGAAPGAATDPTTTEGYLGQAEGRPHDRESGVAPIAIDGPAASGKSTVGRAVAETLGLLYLDTGAMYRAVTWLALRQGIDPADEAAVTQLAQAARFDFPDHGAAAHVNPPIVIDGHDATDGVRDAAVDRAVSTVSAYPGVRTALVREQRAVARSRGVVMVGRDIGTVVLPDAPLKVYLVASAEARARRRYEERAGLGEEADYDEIYGAMLRRDKQDSERAHSPLRPAAGARELDTTGLDIPAVVDRILALARERPPRGRETGASETGASETGASETGASETGASEMAVYRFLYPIVNWLVRVLAHVTLTGTEHLPRSGGVLLVSNHLTNYDPMIVAMNFKRVIHFMGKIELYSNPALAWLFLQLQSFPVRRGEPDRAALRHAEELLRGGRVVGLFPEGHRSLTGVVQVGQPGMALLARRTGAPIVPVAITGTEGLLPRALLRWRPWRRPAITITVGAPFTLPPQSGRADYVALANYIMARIAALLPAAYRGVHADVEAEHAGHGGARA